VMGFCTEYEYHEFLTSVPEFERMLIRADTILIKYWFSVSDEEQERRFQERLTHRVKRWKISPMDLEARTHWFDYAKAKDNMFRYTDTPDSPWWVVDADEKRRARLNCIHHLLSMISYQEIEPPKLKLPRRQPPDPKYMRPPIESMRWVPSPF
jgi:polyphosphate kinase